MSAPSDAAHVRVVRGAPDEHELAALVAGLVVASGHTEDPAPAAWTDRRRVLARPSARPLPPPPGPDSWRWSLHP